MLRRLMIATGLLHPLQRLSYRLRGNQRMMAEMRALDRLAPKARATFGVPMASQGSAGVVLVFGHDSVAGAALNAPVLAGFRAAGYEPVLLLTSRSVMVEGAYRAFGVRRFAFLEDVRVEDPAAAARAMLGPNPTQDGLMALTKGDIKVGKAALSSVMRRLRLGSLDFSRPQVVAAAAAALAESLAAARQAEAILGHFKPTALLCVDRGYTPVAQFVDLAAARALPVFTWNAGHRDNILMLKRYSQATLNDHPFSLSGRSWGHLCAAPWSDARWEETRREIEYCYTSGEWFGEVGTQFNKAAASRAELCQSLGIPPDRKVAVIFPHIFWDATFFWGRDLFPNYEEWYVETVRAAAANPNLTWIIKVHPANLAKDRRDGYSGEHSEITALRRVCDPPPEHIKVVASDTDISTLSFLSLADYCVTVRGTIGIEAASFGIPVVTAGTGRYDRRGFTTDPETPEEYLSVLAKLQDLPPMTPAQVELARRMAWGSFLWRPLSLTTLRSGFEKDAAATLKVAVTVDGPEELAAAPEIISLAAWIRSGEEDYLDVAKDGV